MQYKLIFDVTQTGYHHWSALVGMVIFSVPAIGLLAYKGLAWWCALDKRVKFLFYLSAWGFLISSLGFFHNYPNYLHLQSAMRNSECEVTEGIVTQFHHPPQWKGRGVGETFVVNGLEFSYRDGSAQNGFHQIGIITNGMQIRIYHFDKDDHTDKDITRLEIAK